MSGSQPGGSGSQPGSNGSKPGGNGSKGMERYTSYGLAWFLAMLLGGWLGLTLDRRLGTSPWLLLLGLFGGAGAGLYTLYVRLVVEPAANRTNTNE